MKAPLSGRAFANTGIIAIDRSVAIPVNKDGLFEKFRFQCAAHAYDPAAEPTIILSYQRDYRACRPPCHNRFPEIPDQSIRPHRSRTHDASTLSATARRPPA